MIKIDSLRRFFNQRALVWIVPIVAMSMLVLMVIPQDVWHHPVNDAIYQGFDPNLYYINAQGNSSDKGVIDFTGQSMSLSTLPNSNPTVTLVTSSVSFDSTVDVRILENQKGSDPLRIGIWNPGVGEIPASGYFVDFGPAPDNLIQARIITDGEGGSTLVGGNVTSEQLVGKYTLGLPYRIELKLDKSTGKIYNTVLSVDPPPTASPMLRLKTGYAHEIKSTPISVKSRTEYDFGGLVRSISGSGYYKILLWWFDKDNKFISHSGDWLNVNQLNDRWTLVQFKANVPPNAVSLRMDLGTGEGTELLITDLYIKENVDQEKNLLINNNFSLGTIGWESVSEPPFEMELLPPYSPITFESWLSVNQAPDLLNRRFLSLTASASAKFGVSQVTLNNYELCLPNQQNTVGKTSDKLARVLLISLLGTGGILLSIAIWRHKRALSGISYELSKDVSELVSNGIIKTRSFKTFAIGTAIVFIIVNIIVFPLVSVPFDMTGQRLWSYVAVHYGPDSLYHLPNTLTLAGIDAGRPDAAAIFPYEPMLAYLNYFIGSTHALTSNPDVNTLPSEWLIKLFNLPFFFASGLLIFLILRQIKVSLQWSLLAAIIFLFNPAVWFNTSVWGSTQVFSIFFILLSIWLSEKQHLTGAWTTLGLGVLTRPQILIPAFILGLIYLRKSAFKTNLIAFSWSIILNFLVIAPFTLTISPSLPVDIMKSSLFTQLGGGNEPSWTVVSAEAYNLWPIVTRVVGGSSGLDRFYYPSAEQLVFGLTYQRVGELIAIVILIVTSALLLFKQKLSNNYKNYFPLLAVGTIGFLLFTTGLGPGHLVLAIPLLILCKKSLSNHVFYLVITIWTITTLVSMFAYLGRSLTYTGYSASFFNPNNNSVAQFFVSLNAEDTFITLGCIANLLTWVILVAAVFKSLLSQKGLSLRRMATR